MIKQVIKRILLSEKRAGFFIFLSVLILPLLQVAGIFIIYLIIDPEKQLLVKDTILNYDLFDEVSPFILSLNFPLVLFVTSILIMIIYSVLKYTSDMSLVKLTYNLYLNDSQIMLNKVLRVHPQNFRKIGTDKLTSNIINEAVAFGTLVKDFINLLAAVSMIVVYLSTAIFLSIPMTIIAVLVSVLPLLLSRKLFLTMKNVGRMKVSANQKIMGFFNDFLRGYNRIKLDALENDFLNRSLPVLVKSRS